MSGDDDDFSGVEADDIGSSGFDGSDSFTEVSHESLFQRIGKAIGGVVIGLILFLVSFPLLWWNEGRSVRTAKGLTELGGQIASVESGKIDPEHEKKPIHVMAEATTNETLADPVFSVAANAIKLRRVVEMYQWKETKHTKKRKRTGGGSSTQTTYSYDKAWHEGRINSNNFHNSSSHQNPELRYPQAEQVAKEVRLGAFRLSLELIQQMRDYIALPFALAENENMPSEIHEQVVLQDGWLYMPNASQHSKVDPQHPMVGDTRIRFEIVKPALVSVAAQQFGNTFEPWHSHSDTTIERLMMGSVSAGEMIHKMEEENMWMTWGLRLLGFVLMAMGISMCLSPFQVFADVIPFIGDLIGMGVALFSGVVAGFLSLVTIGMAWIAYRPLIGILLIVIATGLVVLTKMLRRRAEPPMATLVDK